MKATKKITAHLERAALIIERIEESEKAILMHVDNAKMFKNVGHTREARKAEKRAENKKTVINRLWKKHAETIKAIQTIQFSKICAL